SELKPMQFGSGIHASAAAVRLGCLKILSPKWFTSGRTTYPRMTVQFVGGGAGGAGGCGGGRGLGCGGLGGGGLMILEYRQTSGLNCDGVTLVLSQPSLLKPLQLMSLSQAVAASNASGACVISSPAWSVLTCWM
ncbi:hypothetical protein Vafri_15179, partial [Volvox africanus]